MNIPPVSPLVSRNTYIGIFLVALSTLMYEILLTRIFSVTMGYHFAFMAVSLAMFGMTVGAIIVYVLPQKFPQENIHSVLAKQSFYFSIATIASVLIHTAIPFIHSLSVTGILFTVFTYAEISVPFVFSGICVSLLLTRFPGSINKLYASDLIGASLGCILVVIVLNLSGGPTGVFISAVFSSFASLFFFKDAVNVKNFRKGAVIYTIVIVLFSVFHTFLVQEHNPVLRLFWIRGEWSEKPLYEKWNSFSRISVDGDSTKPEIPFGWGLSTEYDRSRKIRQLMLNVDAHSTTVLSHFNGDTTELFHLRYDISNIANYMRPNSDVMIIGSGAGRDVLSSIEFSQRSTLAIEINKDMISAVNGDFGDFTGHLDKYPNVKFVGDEARSYIQRMDTARKFDIIQVSVIDNRASAASGAFVLMENALYTVETWKLLLNRLKPDGILTVTRFYWPIPLDHYRIMNITADAFRDIGINDLRSHVMLLKCRMPERTPDNSGTGTFLISRSSFTEKDVNTVDSICKVFNFEKIITPTFESDSIFVKLTNEANREEFNNSLPINITAPTDNKPYFFNYMDFTDIIHPQIWKTWGLIYNVKAISIVITLAFTMLLLSILCIVIPLKMTKRKISVKGSLGLFLFFISIGIGFMMIEISQIQRLSIFLGHPTYSLSAALFTLLLSSGIGSYLSGGKLKGPGKPGYKIRLFILLIVLTLFGIFTPYIIEVFRSSSTEIRILTAVITLFPMGVFLGMAFPIGMKLASFRNPAITPWLWGINGVMSVMATVISIIVAMKYGISASYWTGAICYLFAFILYLKITATGKSSH